MKEDRSHPLLIIGGIVVGMTIYMPFGNWMFGTSFIEYAGRTLHVAFVAAVVLWLHRDRSKSVFKSRKGASQ